jgi:hypothetical protein
MKNNCALFLTAVVIGSVLMVALAPGAKPDTKPVPVEISLGQSKEAIYKVLGSPDFSILGGARGSESESYFMYNLNVCYRDNKAAVLTVGLIGAGLPGGLPRPKHDMVQHTVVLLKQGVELKKSTEGG